MFYDSTFRSEDEAYLHMLQITLIALLNKTY
jgi:hypothetical protein